MHRTLCAVDYKQVCWKLIYMQMDIPRLTVPIMGTLILSGRFILFNKDTKPIEKLIDNRVGIFFILTDIKR